MISRWCTLLIFIGLFSGMVAASGEISVVNNIRMGERDGNVVTGATYPQYLFGGYEYLPRIGGTGVAYSGNVRVQRSTVSLDFSNAGYSSHRPIITQTDNWGIEAWLQSDNGSLTSVIAYNGNSASSGMGLYQHQGKYVGLVGGKVFVGGVPVSANWTHLAIVAQNGVTTFYVNGVANATGPLPELPAGRFNIGNRPDLLEQFDGRIDEVRAFTFAAGNFSVADLQTTAVAAEQIAPKLPFGVPLANRQGTLTVDFPSAPPGAGWRFAGEKEWRSTGGSATGLQTELLPSRLDRILEFRPVAGYQHPSQEMINIARGEGPLVLTRNYIAGAPAATGAVSVLLHPSSIALPALPPAARAQWRLLGENDSHWQESGGTLPNLAPGSYLIECKPIDARTAPPPIAVTVLENTTTTVAATYSLPASQTGTAPMPVSFETVNTSPSLPCQYVGQLRSDTSAGTGFVVRSQVVATAGDVVFDDATLSAVTGLQWLFQRDPGNYEPEPSIPRGFYLMAGYAAQKAQDNSPGTNSPEARNLDMAALYFQGFAGRSGYNGSLASGSTANEWILSGALKTLVSYPFAEIPLVNRSRMHMTLPANVTFTQTAAHTYTTPDLRGNRGSEGGPLCVQVGAGYYPVAILLGGIGQTVVREIDTAAVQLFDYLQDQSEFDGKPDAGFTISNSPLSGASSASASLKVILTPSVPANSARWKLGSGGTAFTSGSQQNGLVPGIYYIYFTDIPGFLPPHNGSQDAGLIVLPAGTLTTVTATYKGITTQPINRVALPGGSATFSIGVSGAPSAFQWKLNGANIPGATSAAYTRSNITAASAGAYSVEVTWTTGTMTSSAASLQLKQTITFNSLPNRVLDDGPFVLSANADSGLPVSFTLVSGPATLTDATLTPTGFGTVTVRARQNGSASYAAATVVNQSFEVIGDNFGTWRRRFFTDAEFNNASVSGPLVDFEGDGLNALLEFALHLNPKVRDRATMIAGTGTGGLPLVRLETIGGQRKLTAEFVRRRAASNPGITYRMEFCGSLSGVPVWAPGGAETVTPIDTSWERVKVIDSQAATANRFGRLKVSEP